jgi:uncharacterized protein GlcG (DUF336 family)
VNAGPLVTAATPDQFRASIFPLAIGDLADCNEEAMPRSYTSLTLDDAKQMLQASEAAAARIGIAYNIAVVDAGGNLIAFVRQDGALIGSIDLAICKARTARLFDKTTSELAHLAQPDGPLFGIEQSNEGKVVIFGGGLPVRIGGSIVGAVGTSAGSVEQDEAVAQAALAAVEDAPDAAGQSSTHASQETAR